MTRIIRPQKGPQEKFLATSADIAIYGGSAGGGKTYAMLMEPLRYVNVVGFRGVIFRSSYTQIHASGGLWDESQKMYDGIPGACPRLTPKYQWRFSNRATLYFDYLGRDADVKNWQGSQLTFLGFDELTHFSEYQFFYMLSRNRSACGVRPYVRATCNPDADSWVAKFISWWIDEDTGYPIPERSGKVRWMARIGNHIYWADSRSELCEQNPDIDITDPKSVTFIASSVYDNQELLKVNPSYLSNLKALPEVERERLLMGNWKIKASGGMFFKRTQVEMIEAAPADIVRYCRAWDIAATVDKKTSADPDYTSGVLMGIRKDNTVAVLDVINKRVGASEVEKLIYNTALIDRKQYGSRYTVRIPQDPGAAGKIVADRYVKMLAGFSVKAIPPSKNKQVRATPLAAQWQNGNVQILLADWNDVYLAQMESFPESKHDDMVDASSDAFTEVTSATFSLKSLI